MFIVKIHKGIKEERVVVISDKEIIGKKFDEGKLQLNLSSKFYKGEEMKKEEVEKILKEPCTLHLTGKKTVNFFLELNLVNKDNVLVINGVPHTEVCLI